jgi:predicted RNA methylase
VAICVELLGGVPIDTAGKSFMDIGCGKGMVLRVANELGYNKIAGLDLDQHMLDIAEKNMRILNIDVELINANAIEYDNYQDFDVFYMYNPFGVKILQSVVKKIRESQNERNRDIWIIFYADKQKIDFEALQFKTEKVIKDHSRGNTGWLYLLPARNY